MQTPDYTEGYVAAMVFVANAYETLGETNTAAEIRSMHTPETSVLAQDRQSLLNRETSLSMQIKLMRYSFERILAIDWKYDGTDKLARARQIATDALAESV